VDTWTLFSHPEDGGRDAALAAAAATAWLAAHGSSGGTPEGLLDRLEQVGGGWRVGWDGAAGVLRECIACLQLKMHWLQANLPVANSGAVLRPSSLAFNTPVPRPTPHRCTPPKTTSIAQITTTDEMRSKLTLIRTSLQLVGQLPLIPSTKSPSPSSAAPTSSSSSSSGGGGAAVCSWREFWQSDAWGRMVQTHHSLTDRGYATLGTQAVAVAVWALVTNWRQPQQAVVIAASLGGSSGTTAALAGGFAGAMHGSRWILDRWWEAMGEGEGEAAVRDAAMATALRLQRAGDASAEGEA